MDSVNGSRDLSGYANCIYADQDSINSVLLEGPPEARWSQGTFDPTAFVKIIYCQWTDSVEQLGPDGLADDELRRKYNEGDEGYQPIDGCSLKDVGWMKVAAWLLIPGFYELLMDNGWHSTYARPPEIVMG